MVADGIVCVIQVQAPSGGPGPESIGRSSGYEAGVGVNKVMDSDDMTLGFNAANGEYVNMLEEGIIDPLKVSRIALLNATSVSSLLLTSEATISDVKEPDLDIPSPSMPDMGGMGGMGM